MLMATPALPWTEEEARADTVGKKEILAWIQESASFEFLDEKNLKGSLKNIVKRLNKDDVIKHYLSLLESKAFKAQSEKVTDTRKEESTAQLADETSKLSVSTDGEEDTGAKKKDTTAKVAAETSKVSKSISKPAEAVQYKKVVLKKGNKLDYPKEGDTVKVYYTGKLENGTVFDTNIHPKKRGKIQPLDFKIGKGKVIRGWDEGIMTMSLGEKATLTIEPDWAYGRKGKPPTIPGKATLIFEVELVAVEQKN